MLVPARKSMSEEKMVIMGEVKEEKKRSIERAKRDSM
jgi:hypothetical protein